MIYCPFKYSEKYTYCNCPYPKRDIDYDKPLRDLSVEWREHMMELCDNPYEIEELDEVHSI